MALGTGALTAPQRELIERWLPGGSVVRDHSWGLVGMTVLEVLHDGARYIVKAGDVRDVQIVRELRAHREWLRPWTVAQRAPELVAKYSAKLLDSSADAYIAIARLHPPAGREQFFRAGLLKPYFRQLHAAERLYIQIIATKRKDGAQPLLAEAQAAKRDLTIFVAKNGLDRCV